MGIVLKGGKIVTAVDTYYSDVRIEDEKIVYIGNDLEKPGDEIIPCRWLLYSTWRYRYSYTF